MRFKQILIGFWAVLSLLSISTFGQQANKLPVLNQKEYRLKNGLTVILHQDRSTPIVAVNMWYHVGSKNEAPGPNRLRSPL